MSYAIIRGQNGRRHEVDFEDTDLRVEVYANEVTVEVVIETVSDGLDGHKPRFALINLPRSAFDQALAEWARTGGSKLKAVK
jgi:hypothetical protein